MKQLGLFTLVIIAVGMATSSLVAGGNYPIVDIGQTHCYDNQRAITAPKSGQPFYGQDVQSRDATGAARRAM